jgi:hypothetical protein
MINTLESNIDDNATKDEKYLKPRAHDNGFPFPLVPFLRIK